MSIKTVGDILLADAAVTALVGDRVSPVDQKEFEYPSITLQESSMIPLNAMNGWAGLDHFTIKANYWGTTYASAKSTADAGRAALQAAGLPMQNEALNFDDQAALSGLSCITQEWSVWI